MIILREKCRKNNLKITRIDIKLSSRWGPSTPWGPCLCEDQLLVNIYKFWQICTDFHRSNCIPLLFHQRQLVLSGIHPIFNYIHIHVCKMNSCMCGSVEGKEKLPWKDGSKNHYFWLKYHPCKTHKAMLLSYSSYIRSPSQVKLHCSSTGRGILF